MVREGLAWKTMVLMRSVVERPVTHSVSALSYASATDPVEGRMLSVVGWSVTVIEV